MGYTLHGHVFVMYSQSVIFKLIKSKSCVKPLSYWHVTCLKLLANHVMKWLCSNHVSFVRFKCALEVCANCVRK